MATMSSVRLVYYLRPDEPFLLTCGPEKLLDTLKGQDRDILCVKMRPLFDILRKQGHSGRQAAAVDRLWAAINRPQPQPQVQAQAATQNGNPTQSQHLAPSSSEVTS